MEIKVLAKNTFVLAGPKVIAFLVGVIKSKLIAIFIGTTGFGVVDQLSSTIDFIQKSSLSFMPDGMVKLIAEERVNNFDKNKISSIIKTFFSMVLPIMVLVTILAYVFIDQLTLFILGDLKYKNYVILTLLAVPVSFIGASFAALLKSFKEIRAIAMKEIYILIINFLIFIPLVYFFGLKGGVIYVTLSFFVISLVAFFIVKNIVLKKYNLSLRKIYQSKFSKLVSKELLAFIGVGVIAGTAKIIENMASRAIVVNQLGVDKIGVYAPITKWQALFLGFILPAIFTYLYPRLSEAKSDNEVNLVVNDVIRLITFMILPFIIFAISTREWIIPFFYSKDFMEAATYLPIHFAFLITSVWATIMEQIFAPRGKLKVFLIFMLSIYTVSLFLVYYFVPKIGLYGYMLRFTITPVLLVLTFSVYWKYKINFNLKRENIQIVFYSLFCVSLLFIIRNISIYIQVLTGILMICMMFLFMRKDEKKFVLEKGKSFKRMITRK